MFPSTITCFRFLIVKIGYVSYTHFKSCNQSLDKVSFDFSNILHAMQSRAMNAKSSMILNFPRVWSFDLKWVKQALADKSIAIAIKEVDLSPKDQNILYV